jgi:hypothetical protein
VKYIRRADGRPAIADDMPPSTRAVVFLIEHANQRRDDGLSLPCPCVECGWSDRQVAQALAGACAWKDGLAKNGPEWRDALAEFIVAAAGMKGAPIPLPEARRRLLKLMKAA